MLQTIETTTSFMETDFIDSSYREDASKRDTRWIVLAGDRTTPYFKRTFDGMAMGGETLGQDFKTLTLTKGLLRRCQLTPMVVGHDDVNADMLGDDKSKVKSRQAYDADSRQSYTIYYYEILPDDELSGLMQVCQGDADYGIREVTALRNVEPGRRDAEGNYIPSLADEYQIAIFPKWNLYVSGQEKFFPTTAALEAHLLERHNEIVDEDIRSVIEVMLNSNTQFARWATSELDKMSRFVKAPPTDGGKVYGWETIHVQWFEQLELNREEFLQKKSDIPQGETNVPSRDEYDKIWKTLDRLVEVTGNIAERGETKAFPADVVCADVTAKNEPCKARVSKQIGENFYCAKHPKVVEE